VRRRGGPAVIARRVATLVLLSVGVGACVVPELPYVNPPPPSALARLIDTGGRTVGQAVFAQQGSRLRILIDVAGLPPGPKAVHVHEVGQCDVPTFGAAGGHVNPANAQHGTANPRGPHAGDLPDLVVEADGRGHLETTTNRVTLRKGTTSLLDANGSAIVLHERGDDQRTDPDGASGARIVCGVLVQAGRPF
jgi:superoxide dismutase, Cu-Zn family